MSPSSPWPVSLTSPQSASLTSPRPPSLMSPAPATLLTLPRPMSGRPASPMSPWHRLGLHRPGLHATLAASSRVASHRASLPVGPHLPSGLASCITRRLLHCTSPPLRPCFLCHASPPIGPCLASCVTHRLPSHITSCVARCPPSRVASYITPSPWPHHNFHQQLLHSKGPAIAGLLRCRS